MPSPKRKADKKLAGAQDRLRRMEEVIAPFARPRSPQIRPPKSEWIPGEYANVRRVDDDQNHPHMIGVD